jgi:hypothetical protein
VIATEKEERVTETYQLSDMACHYVALEPQIGHKIMELRYARHRASATGANREFLRDEGDVFDAVSQVLNYNAVAARCPAARRLGA